VGDVSLNAVDKMDVVLWMRLCSLCEGGRLNEKPRVHSIMITSLDASLKIYSLIGRDNYTTRLVY